MSGKYEDEKSIPDFFERSKNDLSYTFAKYNYKVYIKSNSTPQEIKKVKEEA